MLYFVMKKPNGEQELKFRSLLKIKSELLPENSKVGELDRTPENDISELEDQSSLDGSLYMAKLSILS